MKNTTVPESTIHNIFYKAAELWADPQAITAAPVEGVARMVKSKSTTSRPHLVQVFKGAKIVCDESCPMWKSLKLCSHCVAVAHSVGCASGFIEWYAANAKKTNITKLTTQNVPRSVGKKSSHAHSSRSKGKTPVTACVAPAFTDQPPYNKSISSSIYNQETEAIPRPPIPLSQLVITPHLIDHLTRAQDHIIHLGMLIHIHNGTHILMDPHLLVCHHFHHLSPVFHHRQCLLVMELRALLVLQDHTLLAMELAVILVLQHHSLLAMEPVVLILQHPSLLPLFLLMVPHYDTNLGLQTKQSHYYVLWLLG